MQNNPNHEPVVRESGLDYELTALVGQDTVVLGWNVGDHVDRSDLLGFGVQRERENLANGAGGEQEWVTQPRRFHTRESHAGVHSTRTEPLQRFSWCDPSIEVGYRYRYSVVPVRGTPKLMHFEAPIEVDVVAPTRIELAERRAFGSNHGTRSASNVALLAQTEYEVLAAGDVAPQALSETEIAVVLVDLIERAESCVFLYTDAPMLPAVARALRDIDPHKLVYGVVPRQGYVNGATSPSVNVLMLASSTSAEASQFVVKSPIGRFGRHFSSAIVADPWGESPRALLWSGGGRFSDPAAASPVRYSEDATIAADIAASVFRSFNLRRQADTQRDSQRRSVHSHDTLMTNGRWSSVYYSRYASSSRYREREVLVGHR